MEETKNIKNEEITTDEKVEEIEVLQEETEEAEEYEVV